MLSKTEMTQLLLLNSVFNEKLSRQNYEEKDAVLHFLQQKAMQVSDNN